MKIIQERKSEFDSKVNSWTKSNLGLEVVNASPEIFYLTYASKIYKDFVSVDYKSNPDFVVVKTN